MRLTAPPEAAGERLDVFLAAHAGSRAAAQKLIDGGRVTVDGQARAKRHTLRGGETVDVEDGPPREPAPAPVIPPFTVVFEDEHLLVVDKPPNLVTHPGSGHPDGTLVQALAGRVRGGSDPARPGVVHRLDRDTSGLLVLTRSDAAHFRLTEAMKERAITREYLALVEGRPAARKGTIDAPLGRDRTRRTRMSSDTDDPRPAITHFEIEEALEHHTLLRVRLETGRTHQIRAHLLAIGVPVAGDSEYGGSTRGLPGLRRQFLHAHRLGLAHPETGEQMIWESPLPEDLEEALRRAAGKRTGPPE